MSTQKVKAASLVLDYNLYPRHQLNTQHIRNLQNSTEAGAQFPPVVADRKTRKVVDGFHRVTRALKYEGADAEIEAEFRNYKDEGAMLLESMVFNSGHGARLSSYDLVRCIVLAEEFSLSPVQVSSALHLTAEKIVELRQNKTAEDPEGNVIPIKRTSMHLAGSRMTRVQVEGNKRSVGFHGVFLVNQVINLVEHRLLDLTNETLVEKLIHLRDLLDKMQKLAKSA